MAVLIIKQTKTEAGQNAYSFEARGTAYTVFTRKCGQVF